MGTERFSDFLIYQERFVYFHSSRFFSSNSKWPFTYPAPAAALVYEMFYGLGRSALGVFVTATIVMPVIVNVIFIRTLYRHGMAAASAAAIAILTLMLSYPFWFEWQRGNIEVFVWLLLCTAIALYLKDHWQSAAFLIGVAASIKIFPFMLLGLFFASKNYRACTVAVFTALISNALGLWALDPHIHESAANISLGLQYFRATYLVQAQDLGVDHSLFALVKVLVFDHTARMIERYTWMLPYYYGCAAIGGLSLFFYRIIWLPRLNQIASLIILSILLPPASYDYTLIHMYIPWAVLVLFWINQPRYVTAAIPIRWMFVLFAVVMSPESFLFIMQIKVAGQLKCVALIALLYLFLYYPLQESPADLATSLPTDLAV